MPVGVEITARQETACQDLLRSESLVSGWLRRKRKLHRLSESLDQKLNGGNNFENLSTLLPWERLFVVLKDGFAYFFNNEIAKRASKVVDLGSFDSVQKVDHIKAKDVAWPFKVVGIQEKKTIYLSASSQDDQQHWIEALKKAIDEAKAEGRRPQQQTTSSPMERSRTSVSSDDDDSIGDDYVDIEENLPKVDDKEARGGGEGGGGGGGGGKDCAEYESQSGFMPSKEQKNRSRPMPPVPSDDVKCKANQRPTPATKPKPIIVENTISRTPPNTAGSQPLPMKLTNPGVRGEEAEDEGDNVQYEGFEESLYSQALWTKSAEEGVQLMRSFGEDGVFMIRQSSSGKEDQTLQVIAKGELKKYKIITEGGRCKMAGGMAFNDIVELLNYYQSHNIPNYDTKLKKPYKEMTKS